MIGKIPEINTPSPVAAALKKTCIFDSHKIDFDVVVGPSIWVIEFDDDDDNETITPKFGCRAARGPYTETHFPSLPQRILTQFNCEVEERCDALDHVVPTKKRQRSRDVHRHRSVVPRRGGLVKGSAKDVPRFASIQDGWDLGTPPFK